MALSIPTRNAIYADRSKDSGSPTGTEANRVGDRYSQELQYVSSDQRLQNYVFRPLGADKFFGTRPYRARSANEVATKIRSYQNQTGGVGTVLRFPAEAVKYYVRLDYSRYSAASLGGINRVAFDSRGTIFLPLPVSGMADTHTVDYIERELGLTGGAASIAQDISPTPGDDNLTVEEKTAFLQRQGLTAAVIANLGPEALFSLFSDTRIGATGQAIYGWAPNKFLTVLLKGPRYKRHEFVWKLVPSNRDESNKILSIIDRLNNCMAPGLGSNQMLFTFPHVFYMQYIPNGQYLYKFKPMVLEDMTVNYVPGGVPSFYTGINSNDNPPESVEIRCRFLEIEYWLRNQFNTTNVTDWDGPHRNYEYGDDGVGIDEPDIRPLPLPDQNPRRTTGT